MSGLVMCSGCYRPFRADLLDEFVRCRRCRGDLFNSVTPFTANPGLNPVTESEARPVGRPKVLRRYESAEDGHCAACGKPIPKTRGGRKVQRVAKFCSDACRQADYRRRRGIA
jgi:hypothetical protein